MTFDLDKIKTLEDLKKIKAEFNSPDSELALLTKQIKEADADKKSEIGKKIQKLRQESNEFFELAKQKIENLEIQKSLNNEWIDTSEPVYKQGGIHPTNLVILRMKDWFNLNGYFEIRENEIENDEYNFERLNIPKDHPARDMQDSLYIDDEILMRTHNTGISARALEKHKNQAFSQFAIGKVYRNDEEDMTHSHQFTQLDFVSVGYTNFGNLIWTLKSLLSYVLEEEIDIRLRPSYFPFTEPSVEVDVFYKEKWIEILGAGMLHQKVLQLAGYTNNMNGFAAGLGIERITMIKYQITDIRELYINDNRFLKQFK
ncbi:phenylalanine--tRNA ligase subunit alpha [Mycoplasma miroungirhinis]|uniref:phenylalanine--tRNA ligase n=1 Tax=Mycoplasma miroungirhinis TaxID=754516 RepID=A0A6M4JCN8_9MOLU|nr:phenylalanine--tRNA ligase subunit alpha [Mycoplasma miroungirhinis]QJR44115.1 phenylalanine--tRNA ligase subunit alpha [Mycoplasma miroungirhinis]